MGGLVFELVSGSVGMLICGRLSGWGIGSFRLFDVWKGGLVGWLDVCVGGMFDA